MGISVLFKRAFVSVTATAALAGLATVAGVTAAVARTVPAAHRGAARQPGSAARRHAAGFSNWPMFRDGPAHLGVSPETTISTATASTLTAGYATNANGTPVVVFGSVDPDNSVYALNAKTGAKIWTYRTSKTTANDDVGAAPTISAPGVNGFAGGVVYITGKDKVTYALDLTTGRLIWQHALAIGKAGDIAGSALAGNTVYVDSDTGAYAFNATTGAQVWHVLPKAGIYASPAISGPAGQQVLITANLAGNIYALNPVTGKTLWTQPGKSSYWSSATVSQGTIYITSKNGKLLTFAPASG